VLVTGEPLLLRVQGGAAATTVEPGVVTVANPCMSGGTVEIFLEPRRPAPRLLVVGTTPVAQALAALGAPLGYAVETGPELGACDDAAAVVVASHGRGEEPALEGCARRRGRPYVGLVASRVRAAARSLGIPRGAGRRPGAQARPAGPRLPQAAPEIALSILAEVVATRAVGPALPAPVAVEPTDDPCDPGLPRHVTVAVSAAVPQARSLG
jgi:xanthine dehydrogenase accessory factor